MADSEQGDRHDHDSRHAGGKHEHRAGVGGDDTTVTAAATRDGADADQPLSEQQRWGRFQQVRLLGSGGMGEVYEAHDPHLQRQVAVKVLHDERPQSVQRFIREARAQARVEHEHICPIYEVGEADGKPHIVMQLIRGQTLAQAALEMSLEQKVLVMQKVATAVHEAHRVGLIHRDIKPSNIMVEESAGEFKPYVMDFGIARAPGEAGMTTEGAFIGTPAYSAPEQVRGERDAIDRRTDVYALGATLYSLLSGEPPFSGPTPAVLMAVVDTTPQSLRRRRIPADIETITLRCLEKEPEQRYGSARAVAEELRRFLDGEPIMARPVGVAVRLLRRARRHRALTAIAAAAVLLVSLALAWGAYTRWQAGARERLVRELTTQVAGIEAQTRYSHLSPHHAIAPDLARLQHKMAAIEEWIEGGGDLAGGPGHYALGRGHLLLEDLDQARHHLELAWAADHREPVVAQALGMTLSLQYRERLAEIEVISDEALRSQRRQQLHQELQEPAVRYLGLAQGLEEQDQRYLQALLAFHQDELDQALQLLADDEVFPAWFYEADKLTGDIYRQRALHRREQGDPKGARQDLTLAAQAYQAAQRTAPSSIGVYLAAAQTQLLVMSMDELTATDLEPAYEQGLQQIELASQLVAENPRVLLLEAQLHHRMAEHQRQHQKDPTAYLVPALAAIEAGTALAPESAQAWIRASAIYSSWALWLGEQGDDSQQGEMISHAIAALERVSSNRRDYTYYTLLGIALSNRGQLSSGDDARQDHSNALAAYRKAIALHPRPVPAAYSNLNSCLRKLSSISEPEQQMTYIEEAISGLEAALHVDATNPVPYYYLGLYYTSLAMAGDPFSGRFGPESEIALEYLQKGLELSPKLPHFYSGIGEIYYHRAMQAWDRGGDAESLLAEADAIYRRGIEVSPSYIYLHLNLAWASYYRGKYRIREGRDLGDSLTQALQQAQQALSIKHHDGAVLCVGSVYRMLAEHDLRLQRSPGRHLSRAEATLSELLQGQPEHVSAHRALGRLLTLKARWLTATGNDPQPAFAAAGQALETALAAKPDAPAICLAEARRCLRQAEWLVKQEAPIADLVTRGLEHTGCALAAVDGWPEALAVGACLRYLGAVTKPADQAQQQQARDQLRQALAANRHLSHEWATFMTDLPVIPSVPVQTLRER